MRPTGIIWDLSNSKFAPNSSHQDAVSHADFDVHSALGACYRPPTLLQLLLISILWAAMFAYSRRWGARLSALVLTLGILTPILTILGMRICCGLGEYGDTCRAWSDHNHSDAFLIIVQFFELWEFAICAFIGLVVALFVIPVAATWHERDGAGGGKYEDAVSSTIGR